MQFLGKKVEIDENGNEIVVLGYIDDNGELQKEILD